VKYSLLVVDDEESIRSSLKRVLTAEGFRVETAATVAAGRAALADSPPDVVIMDLKLPDGNGLDFLQEVRRLDRGVQTILITAYGDVQQAVEAMKAGAGDFLKKPYELDELLIAVRGAVRNLDRDTQLAGFRRRALERHHADRMIGRCPAMEEVAGLIDKVSQSDATTVLITGESGTGKELVARAVHYGSSRAAYPLMEVNCSSFQEGLLENELFGHERGAYTDARETKKGLVELCDQGTLFLDEVGDMPLSTQAKLLRFIDLKSFKRVGGVQDIAVDIRIITATNKRLDDAVSDQSFREDLYYRLKVISINLPPLRERGTDILLLAEHFLELFNRKFKKHFRRLSGAASEILLAYEWPGNVRELKNVLERAVLLEDGDELSTEMLTPEIVRRQSARDDRLRSLAEVEESHILSILESTGWNKSRSARVLGISRQGLLDRLKRMRVEVNDRGA
jgi:DNA-binding NtrC family response regulator